MADTGDNPQEVRQILSKVADGGTAQPVPALNGRLLKHPDRPEVYLVVNGFRRHVLNQKTMDSLFVGGRVVDKEPLIDFISLGEAIASGALTVKGDATGAHGDRWYFLPGQYKMYIGTTTISSQYQFRAVTVLPQVVIDSIPEGPSLEGRAK